MKPDNNILIRNAAEPDRDQIAVLARSLASTFTFDDEAFLDIFARILKEKNASLMVAESDGVIVGYLLGFIHDAFFASGKVTWVEEIIVSESYRKRGVGRLLMEAFEEQCAAQKVKLVALATRRAESFYKALQYEPSATYFRKIL